MLVIVNPYATTVSDRLKTLVVHALGSRYEVTAFDTQRQGHATELTREAAREGYDVVVAFGGDGTLNEAANGLAGTDVPLTHLPGGATNVFCKMLGDPRRDRRRDRAPAADRRRLAAAARSTSAARTGRYFCASAGYGLDAAVTKAVDLKSAPQAPLRRVVLHVGGRADVLPPLPRPPAARRARGRRRHARCAGIDAIVQNGDPYTYFNVRPLHVAENSRSTAAGSPARCSTARRRSTSRPSPTACSREAPRSSTTARSPASPASAAVRAALGRRRRRPAPARRRLGRRLRDGRVHGLARRADRRSASDRAVDGPALGRCRPRRRR